MSEDEAIDEPALAAVPAAMPASAPTSSPCIDLSDDPAPAPAAAAPAAAASAKRKTEGDEVEARPAMKAAPAAAASAKRKAEGDEEARPAMKKRKKPIDGAVAKVRTALSRQLASLPQAAPAAVPAVSAASLHAAMQAEEARVAAAAAAAAAATAAAASTAAAAAESAATKASEAAAASAAALAAAKASASCTVCEGQISGRDVWPHTALHHVAVCGRCFTQLSQDAASATTDGALAHAQGEEEEDEQEEGERCAWCLDEGVEVLCCDTCPRGICEHCIHQNLGKAAHTGALAADPWSCYHCELQEAKEAKELGTSAPSSVAGRPLARLQAKFVGSGGADGPRDQILTDQCMGIEEEIEDIDRALEPSQVDQLRKDIRAELGGTVVPDDLEASVEEEMTAHALECKTKLGLLEAKKLALYEALEPLLRAQGQSLKGVLMAREKLVQGQQPGGEDDPWRDTVVRCCESDSEGSDDDVVEPAVASIDRSQVPDYVRAANKVLKKREKKKQELGPLPNTDLYNVTTPAEAREKGLSGTVDEIADIDDHSYDGTSWHHHGLARRKFTAEQVRQADVAEQRSLRELDAAARPRIRKKLTKKPTPAGTSSAAAAAAAKDEDNSRSSDDSDEEEEPAYVAPPTKRSNSARSRPMARAPQETRPAWQGSAAAARVIGAGELEVGMYTGPGSGEQLKITLPAGEDAEGWPALPKYLKTHQEEGLQFMWQRSVASASGCVLGHCMGLGKTLEVIALIRGIYEYGLKIRDSPSSVPPDRPACILIVSPKNTLHNWGDEFKHWAGKVSAKVIDDKASKAQRLSSIQGWYRTGGVLLLSPTMFTKVGTSKYADLSEELQKKDINELDKMATDRGWSGTDIEEAWATEDPKSTFMAMLLEEAAWMQDPGPDLVIVDEAHSLKNTRNLLGTCLSNIKTHRRIAMTGTPFQNNLLEYYSMLDWVKPGSLGTVNDYKNQYVEAIEKGQHADSSLKDVNRMKRRAHALHKKLENVIHRRDHAVLERDLPTKHEYVLYVRLSDLQRDLYHAYLKRREGQLDEGSKKRGDGVLVDLNQLSQVVSHPQMLRSQEQRSHKAKDKGRTSPPEGRTSPAEDLDESLSPRPPSPELSDDKWWEDILPPVSEDIAEDIKTSPKLVVLLELIKLCLKAKEKMLIFSKSTAMLDVVQRVLCGTAHPDPSSADIANATAGTEPTWQDDRHYCRLDGSTEGKRRQDLCNKFNRSEYQPGGCSVFLISTTAGGMGINLVAASRCVMLDDHFVSFSMEES